MGKPKDQTSPYERRLLDGAGSPRKPQGPRSPASIVQRQGDRSSGDDDEAATKTKRQQPVPPGAVFISAPQVCDRYGGRSHMWLERKLQNDPAFPRPTYIGRLRFWVIAELEAYERNAAAATRPVAETAG
jgi:predicted DNA-binding transcriptional regulator AlpA